MIYSFILLIFEDLNDSSHVTLQLSIIIRQFAEKSKV